MVVLRIELMLLRLLGGRPSDARHDAALAPDPSRTIARAVSKLLPPPRRWIDLAATLGMIGDRATLEGLRAGEDPRAIAARWQPPLERFRALRAKYLIY